MSVIVRRIKEVDAAVNRGFDQFIGPGLVSGADGLEESSAIPESETYREARPAPAGSCSTN